MKLYLDDGGFGEMTVLTLTENLIIGMNDIYLDAWIVRNYSVPDQILNRHFRCRIFDRSKLEAARKRRGHLCECCSENPVILQGQWCRYCQKDYGGNGTPSQRKHDIVDMYFDTGYHESMTLKEFFEKIGYRDPGDPK